MDACAEPVCIIFARSVNFFMRILITGGAGFVGSGLARHLKETLPDVEIVALDNLRRRGSELNVPILHGLNIDFVHGDIRNRSDLAALTGGFEIVLDCSAEPSVQAGWTGTPDYVVDTNLAGTFNCLNFARERHSKFVLLSTSRVYSIQPLKDINLAEAETRFEILPAQTIPGVTQAGISETFPTDQARSFYGASKLASEQLVQEFGYAYGLDSAIFRCGVIAGPGQFGKSDQGVFTMWVARHYFKRPLCYTGFGGKGKQVRDLLHIQDLCDLAEATIKMNVPYSGEVFNVGGGSERSVSLLELTKLCRKIVGTEVPVSTRPETDGFDVPSYISDCTRFFSRTSWRPQRSVEQIVSDIFDWIRANETVLKPIFS
jgi:CDP-paratose 2-epimerase